jgi:Flp pilus assembly protein TadD
LGFVLAVTLGWANLSFGQTDAGLAQGEELAAAGDIKGALQVYEGLTKAQPESSEAYARLGGMQLLDQHYADAVKSFQRAITLGDNGSRSFIGMGMAYLHMGAMGPARAAFVEARSRGVADPKEVDNIIAWIDGRDGDTPPSIH